MTDGWFPSRGLLTIVRGHQGSGKSTWAFRESATTGAIVVEGDHWRHPTGGFYLWAPEEDGYVRQWIALECLKWLRQGRNVLAVDVFERVSFVKQVEDVTGDAHRIVRMGGNFRNHHAVPDADVALMKEEFEPISGEEFWSFE